MGTWDEPDPSGYTDGADLYCSLGDNPNTYVDYDGLSITTNNGNIAGRPLSSYVVAALQKLCPAVQVSAVPTGGGSVRIEAKRKNDVTPEKFCNDVSQHNTGCRLLHDLLNSSGNISIVPTNRRNGSEQDPDPRFAKGSGKIEWNPLYDASEMFGQGEATSNDPKYNGPGGANNVAILAHELAHAWHGQNGYPKGLKNAMGNPPNAWTLGDARWWNEYFAVMAQNYSFAEMAAAMGGFNFRDPTAWGRKKYGGVNLPKWNKNPFDGCDCEKFYNDSAKGWG